MLALVRACHDAHQNRERAERHFGSFNSFKIRLNSAEIHQNTETIAMEKNSQRVIMISGANRGIGKAIREKLQSENYPLSLGQKS